MHKQAINHKQAIIGGGYLFTENACCLLFLNQPAKKTPSKSPAKGRRPQRSRAKRRRIIIDDSGSDAEASGENIDVFHLLY